MRLNAYLELAGRVATVLWLGLLVSLVIGVDWESLVEKVINSGRPVESAVVLAVVLPTIVFLLARSLLSAAGGVCTASCGEGTSNASRVSRRR